MRQVALSVATHGLKIFSVLLEACHPEPKKLIVC